MRAEKMVQQFDAEFKGELRPRYNIALTQPAFKRTQPSATGKTHDFGTAGRMSR
jgi:hypothetical protein